MTIFPIQSGLLQGNLDANHFGIDNLDISSLGLVKADVGLGNVDNTADADKPLSGATIAALALKENLITAGTTGQFFRGDKTFVDYGELALQDGATTLALISVLSESDSAGNFRANSNSVSYVELVQFGTSTAGQVLSVIPKANSGMLSFKGDAYALIKTDNAAPLIFGTNGQRRMRLEQGLNVGGDVDPGSGCISADQTISAGKLVALDGSGILGLVKNQIPATLNATSFPSVTLLGLGGLGYLQLQAQTLNPSLSAAHVFADTAGRVALGHSGSTQYAIKFDNFRLTASRLYDLPDTSGTIVVGAADSGWTAWTGTGSKATKAVSTATTAENAAAIKSILDLLFSYGMITA